MFYRPAIIFGLLLCLAGPAHAATALDEKESAAVVRSYLNATTSFQAAFIQTQVDEQGRQLEDGRGDIWLQRPGQFRWQYEQPWPRLIIASENTVWLYDEELEQVTVRNLDGELERTPVALLVGDGSELERYHLSGIRTETGLVTVTLKPREKGGDFREINMTFGGNQLKQLRLVDNFAQTTEIEFFVIIKNKPAAQNLFTFVVPDGVDVIDERVGKAR
jgi:outer membrane lipoprotein carrier protein